LVAGDDSTNVEVAVRIYELKKERKHAHSNTPMLDCRVHVVDHDLRALFKEHRVFRDSGDRLRISLFNIYESSARVLFEKYPLDREWIGPNDPRSVQLIVAGFGEMGESMVVQAARMGHFANGRPARIIVIDQDPTEPKGRLQRRYPHIGEICEIEFVPASVNDPELFKHIAEFCGRPNTLSTVVICFDNDARCLSFALGLLPKVKNARIPILTRMSTDRGLATLLKAELTEALLKGLVKPFAVLPAHTHERTLLEIDRRATAMHRHYFEGRGRAEKKADSSLTSWDELDEDLKDSWRHQGDHVAVKLRVLERSGTESRTLPTAPTLIETLARMEHARWKAEQSLAGWVYAPGEKNLESKTTPYLVSWEDLPERMKEQARQVVKTVLRQEF
jgi:hypothetical protein